MKRSTNRILTTHAGRLNGSNELTEAARAIQRGESTDIEGIMPLVRSSMVDVIKKQHDLGIDMLSDGELGKIGFGLPYYGKRLTGLASRPVKEGEAAIMSGNTGERIEFADFYDPLQRRRRRLLGATARTAWWCNGPIKYIGQDEVKQRHRDLQDGLGGLWCNAGRDVHVRAGAGLAGALLLQRVLQDDEEYLFALAEAIARGVQGSRRRRLHAAAGRPGVAGHVRHDRAEPDAWRSIASSRSCASRRRTTPCEGIPADRVRYHICWGSWHGPHTHDLPLKHVVDLMLQVNAEAYSVEAANPQHEHEWKVWRDVKLPEGKILIPGVVSHASNVVEHPELVADRIVQYAVSWWAKRT